VLDLGPVIVLIYFYVSLGGCYEHSSILNIWLNARDLDVQSDGVYQYTLEWVDNV
jgi:hypothetical protein